MTYPRAHLVNPAGGVYHVTSRCVRKAFLLQKRKNKRNRNHRRKWIEQRLLMLAEHMPVDIYGYSVMANHYHVVLNIEAARLATWSDDRVIDGWILLNARNPDRTGHEDRDQQTRDEILKNPQRLQTVRENMTSLSWFMRFLNEFIARTANGEDGCEGRFWAGRFKSQQLLDEAAILACMAYVDLNPLRAGETDDLLQTRYTSLNRRCRFHQRDQQLQPVNNSGVPFPIKYTLGDYLKLVAWTLESQQGLRPTRGFTRVPLRQSISNKSWFRDYFPKAGTFQRAIGSAGLLQQYANSIGQRRIRIY